MMYTGNDGVYTYTFQHQKKPDCPVCGNMALSTELDPEMTLEELIDWLKEKPDMYVTLTAGNVLAARLMVFFFTVN